MSKTIRTYKGKKYTREFSAKGKKPTTKFMGFTDGSHKSEHVANNTHAIAQEDYVKYGYPNDFRRPAEIKAKIEDHLTQELLKEALKPDPLQP